MTEVRRRTEILQACLPPPIPIPIPPMSILEADVAAAAAAPVALDAMLMAVETTFMAMELDPMSILLSCEVWL